MNLSQREKRDLIAQWAFDTSPILGRMHLWLEDVEVEWLRGKTTPEFTQNISFMDGRMERLMAMMVAVTALGTRLFGRFGEGKDQEKSELNRVKKDADAISAYAMSESLWYASRQLPECLRSERPGRWAPIRSSASAGSMLAPRSPNGSMRG